MFQALVQRLLGKILGEYIQNFSAENLKIGIWSGEVVLSNLVLKKSVIRRLNLPLRILYSRLGTLRMTIPWKSLTSSKIVVLLEGLELVVAEVPSSEWECRDSRIIEKRKLQVQALAESLLSGWASRAQKQAGKDKEKGEEGYFSKLVVKIIDNLQVTIRDIHIRYEDTLSKTFAFGVTLEELKLYTVNSKGEPEYVDRSRPENAEEPLRKQLEMYNVGVYWNQKAELFKEDNYQDKMGSTIARRGKPLAHNYLILMTSQATLLQRQPGKQWTQAEIDLQVALEDIRMEITNTQLQQIVTLAERLQAYTRKLRDANRAKLSLEETDANKTAFALLFPTFYDGWGKTMTADDMGRLENILEKMQVEELSGGIQAFLQEKQRERIIKERKQKSKGWWFGKPKELTQEQLNEIQSYLNNNFSQEHQLVKRPQDYYYVRVKLSLKRLQVGIANTLAIIKEGIEARMEDLGIQFCLREGGYGLEISLENISVDMFSQVGVQPRQRKPVLFKLHERTSQLQNAYLKMAVTGNPLNKRHLNTDIKLTTSQLMLRFDPKIITIATEFADLKLSSEYREAAIEKFGEIKQATVSAVSETMEKPSKTKIGVDVTVSCMTVVVPFSPKKQEGDCWGVNLGSIRLTSDEETLLRTETVEGLPLDVFHLELAAFSFRHYSSPEELTHMLVTGAPYSRPAHALLDQLDFRLRVEVFSSATDTRPRLNLVANLPAISVNLNDFTYSNVLRLGDAFAVQSKEQESRQTMRIQEKKEIQRRSVKIGFVYIKGRLTMVWEKYVAIMSENYIYLYLNKNDKDYYAYYYIKGAKLQRFSDPLDTQKPFLFRISNKVNQVVFGFDKEDQIDDWVVKINALNKQQQTAVAASPPSSPAVVAPKKHNQLNLQVVAQIQSIGVRVFTTQSTTDRVISLQFSSLSTKMMLHESKKVISLQLLSMSLTDTLQTYRSKALSHFLQTINGEEQSLIAITVEQLNKDHPDFTHTDSVIHVSIGSLLCNYKCETVQALMGFFVPDAPPPQEAPDTHLSNSTQIEPTNTVSIQVLAQGQENYSLKLFLEIKEISTTLVNSKTRTVQGRLGIADLKLYMGMSQKRMVLQGSQRDLYFIDCSNHPYTITEQQESYEQYQKYILTANIGSEKNMLEFNIQLLKTPNQFGKLLLVDVRLANLTTYFSLQPVLRLITYLTSQMLPSFQAESKQPKPLPTKDGKPEPTTMDLKVQLSNISVFVETARELQRERQQYMQLNIAAITVGNEAAYRDYVRGSKPIILVQTYQVNLYALSIAVHYFDAQGAEHRYKLTNNMDISLSTDLIANPDYYKKELPEDFDNGMRVRCTMTPFYMSINHHDYSFIMKCLNWAISYNDGLDALLFNPPPNAPPTDPQLKQQKDPFYLTLSMDCISLFVTQEDVPIAFLEQTNLAVDFSTKNQQMVTKVTMGQLYGTSIEHDRQTGKLKERGIFNSLGYTAEHSVQDVRDLQSYMKVFDRRSGMGTGDKFLQFALTMDEQAMNIEINMSEICVDADVRLLLVLSTLANTEESYIKGPTPPRLPSLDQREQPDGPLPPASPPKRMSMALSLGKFVSCVSDSSKSKFVFIEGAVGFSMINQGQKSIEQLQAMRGEESISHSTMAATLQGLTLYFSRIRDGKTVSRREILQPMTVQFDQRRFYHMQKDIHMLETDIRLKTTELLLTASLRDMLNINHILQDSLNTMADFNKDQAETKSKIEQSMRQTNISEVDEQALQRELKRMEEKMEKEVQSKMKIIGSVAAMHFQIVNDCGRNFMPMLRLVVEESEPAMQQVLLTTEIILVPIITLEFFNPRSSRWEPILEPFKASLTLTTITLNKIQSTSITLKTGSLEEETSSLKLNLSTQMLSTLMAAKEALSVEQASFKEKDEGDSADIEVSPFIFHNITNQNIYILRDDSQFLLPPLFKGPVRLPNDREVHFRLRQYAMKLTTDHYGVMPLADTGFFIKFDSQRLNKVIQFIPQLIIRNRLRQAVTVRRWGKNDTTIKVEKGEAVPLDGVESFAVSINGTSYTERLLVGSVKLVGVMLAEKKNFLVLLRYKQRAGKFAVLELLPPFVVYNCLPKPLSLQFLQKAKLKSTVAVPPQQAYSIFTAEDVHGLQVKATTVGFTWSKKFKFVAENEGEGQLQLGDEDNFRTVLTYRFLREASGQYRLTIYCRKFIVNELSDKLLVYGNGERQEREGKRDDFSLVGGQRRQQDNLDEKIILLGEEVGNRLRVCGAHSHVDFATPIAVGGLGSSQARIVVDRERGGHRKSLFSVIGVEISAVRMSKHCQVFSKKIVLRSKAIFVNSTPRDISIREEAAIASIFRSEAGSRKSLVFGLPEIDGQQPTYTISSQGLKPSRSLVLPTQGSVFFKLKGEEGSRDSYFRIIVKEVECYCFYELTEIAPQDFPYQVIVKSSSLRARLPALQQIITRGQECRFIGEQFGSGEAGEQLELWVGHVDSEDEVKIMVSPDDLKFKQKHLMRISRGGLEGSLAIKVEVTVRDKQRAIVIDEQTRMEEPKEMQESAISIELAEIVLSISQNSQAVEVPYESLVITLRRLQLIKLQTDKRVQYQAKLGFLQIDQAYPHVIASPVVLTPHRFAEYTREVDPKAVFNFTVVLSKQFVRNTFISEISVDLGDLVATFSADFLALATTISSEFAEVANYRQESYLVQRKEEEWQGLVVPPQGKAVFVRCIRIAPFVVDLSAELNLKKLNLQNNVLLTTVLSTVGVVVSNIDSAPITMTGIEIDDCIDSMDSITRRLMAHYKATCVSQFYKVVGSLNIIGNPLSLFRNISTGVKDLKDKPAKGFVNGPAEFGLGIVEGTTSLVAHSVGGAFNSIAKVTGTVSSGLATLAFDREFQEHREKERMKKPQNVIQGVAKGGKAIFYGFKEGITGVFMQPLENARREGAIGFFKGAGKGLAGLVVKPVTGIIDFASKTTQGIKNNALMFQDKARDERMRHPRVFYSQCFILKEYSPRDSQLFAILKKVDNEQKFQNPVFVDAFQSDKEKHFLILLLSGVAYLDGEGRKLKWAIEYPELQLQNSGKKLHFKKGGKSGSFFHNYEVEMEDDEARNIVAELVVAQKRDRLAQ